MYNCGGQTYGSGNEQPLSPEETEDWDNTVADGLDEDKSEEEE